MNYPVDISNARIIVPRNPIVVCIGSWPTVQNKQNNPSYFEPPVMSYEQVFYFISWLLMFHLLTSRSRLLIGPPYV